MTCLDPETGNTEIITGKQGRDTVFALKNPETTDLPTSQIKDVEPGNLVATRNPQTGKTEFGRVVRTIQRQTDALVTVRLADSKTGQAASSLTCTPEHPLFVTGQGWVEAGSLGTGSSIVTRAGLPLVVKGVDWQRAKSGTKPFTVYNFEVAGSHTYFVGTTGGGTWVHNVNCVINPETRRSIADILRRINRGDPHPYPRDGITFQNRPLPGETVPELPAQPSGYYQEYTVPTPGLATRGAQRLVTGNGGEIYYTPDHYTTFLPLK